MAFIQTTTSTVIATLTRDGRRMMASDTARFNVTKWAVADDEINYRLMDSDGTTNVDQTTASITGLPIAEPSTNAASEMLLKIFVNQHFLTQHFVDDVAGNQYITVLVSTGGSKINLHSDDVSTKVKVSFNSINSQGRNYIAPYYQVDVNNNYDFYVVDFLYPPLNAFSNDNWEEIGGNSGIIAPPQNFTALNNTGNTLNVSQSTIGNMGQLPSEITPVVNPNTNIVQGGGKAGSYIFNKSSKSGNNPYNGTPFNSPSVVLQVRFQETVQYHETKLLPQFRQSISIPSFIRIIELDVNKQAKTDTQPVTVPLEIINVVF